MFHVMNNFEHYNRGDTIPSDANVLPELRKIISDAQHRQDDGVFDEGTQRLKMHYYRERDSEAARQFKSEALSKGQLICESCGKDYFAIYGEQAIRVIECHHKIPISSNEHGGKTKKSDLALLCANCHRLAHTKIPPIPIHELAVYVKKANGNDS
jgi:predicted HNH restriction endonuclease